MVVNGSGRAPIRNKKCLTFHCNNKEVVLKNLSLYIDLAFCIVVLPLMTLIFPIERWFHNFPWYVVSIGVWLYFLYFLNRFLTVPYLFRRGKCFMAGIAMAVLPFLVTYVISCVTLYPPKPSIHDMGIGRVFPNIQQYQQAVWSLFMIVEAFSFAVGLLTQTNIQRSRRRAVESERDKAEISLYKAQIKPHFMFNTLNSLYGLFLMKDENALASLEKFISMMRYMHTTSMCDFVPLSEEVDYIKQYVGLQKLRLNEMTSVILDVDIADSSLTIPPMLLVTFVENCFKHGVSPVEKGCIKMCLREKDGKMEFLTTNHVFPVKRMGGEHMGIDNCRKRLGLIYPGKHQLEIINEGSSFKVKLIIDLKA